MNTKRLEFENVSRDPIPVPNLYQRVILNKPVLDRNPNRMGKRKGSRKPVTAKKVEPLGASSLLADPADPRSEQLQMLILQPREDRLCETVRR